ncbi:keratin, type 1 cytoskeletal 11, partial [Aplysia californica]|uniref:Keratin, type 1 cytoskeletal 11 n=1 Tax=Aplysia californica TaxID=6500 RepID=A0ABM1W5B4_APLCA
MESKKKLSDLDPMLGSLSTEDEQRVLSILEDRDKIIMLQQMQIERMESELKHVKAERDLLQIRLAAAQMDTSTDNSYSTDDTVTGVKAYNDPAASLRGSGQRSNSQGSGGGGGGGGGGGPPPHAMPLPGLSRSESVGGGGGGGIPPSLAPHSLPSPGSQPVSPPSQTSAQQQQQQQQ